MAGLDNSLGEAESRPHDHPVRARRRGLHRLLSLVLSGRAAILVLDKPSQHFVYPFTIQNLMHIVFFVGLGDLFVRWRIATREKNFLRPALSAGGRPDRARDAGSRTDPETRRRAVRSRERFPAVADQHRRLAISIEFLGRTGGRGR